MGEVSCESLQGFKRVKANLLTNHTGLVNVICAETTKICMKKIQFLSVDKLANSMTNRFQSKTTI